MDVELSDDHDILSTKGFLNMLFQCMNLQAGAAAWTAPVCSSWTFMTLAATG